MHALSDFLAAESNAGRTAFGVLGYGVGRWIEPSVRRQMRGELPPVPGTTREHVLRLPRAHGLLVLEHRILIDDFKKPDKAFLTASTIETIPIHAIEGRPWRPSDRRRGLYIGTLSCCSEGVNKSGRFD